MLGTDIIEVSRIEKILESTHCNSFLKRVFTKDELNYCRHKDNSSYRSSSLAARFCAKEAVMKVLGEGFGKIDWKEIEVYNNTSGKPFIHLYGKATKLAQDNGFRDIQISLSHTDNYATAAAIGLS